MVSQRKVPVLLKTIVNLFLKISNYGVKDDTPQSNKRHIQIVNYSNMMAILAILMFDVFDCIVAYQALHTSVFISLLFIPPLILSIYLNSIYKYRAARNLFIFAGLSIIFVSAAFLIGKEAGEQNLFVLFAVIGFTVNPEKSWKTILIICVICVLLYLSIELDAVPGRVLTPFPAEFIKSYRIFTNLSIFFTLVITFVFYEIRISRNEQLIESYTSNLEKINNELIHINEEVLANQDTLSKLNIKKDQMFSIIAHDLKNPIGNIVASSEMAYKKLVSNEKESAELFMKGILKASKNTFSLLEDLIDWAKIQHNNVGFNPVKLNINDLLIEMKEYFQDSLSNKKLKLETDNTKLEVNADREMLKTVLRNLISNAIKFSYPDGKIQVSAFYSDTYAVIAVKDNGTGMTNEKVNQILEGEEITSSIGTSKEKGTGLGLSICRELIAKNNGIFHMESEVDKGTLIKVFFPK